MEDNSNGMKINSGQFGINIYGGLSLTPFKSSGFNQFDISDWEKYGLKKYNATSAEGRVTIPLDERKINGLKFGLFFGASVKIDKFSPLVEYNYSFANNFKVQSIFAGSEYEIINSNGFRFSLLGKLGYLWGSSDFGNIQLLNGYTPPVIISQGKFDSGDKITASISGLGLHLGLSINKSINDKIELFVKPQFAIMAASGLKLIVTGENAKSNTEELITLDLEDNAIVQSNGTSNQININPKIKSNGLMFQFGVNYKFQ